MTVNNNIPKIDGIGLVTGKPAYTADLAHENALIVKVLRSPHAYARIVEIKTQNAENLKGIECVLTYKSVPNQIFSRAGQGYPEPSPYDRRILDEFVRYVGDSVAVVAGVTEASVDRALKLIQVDYEILEAVIDYETAIDNPVIVHEEADAKSMFEIGYNPKRNMAASYSMEVGNVEEVLRDCHEVYRGRYYTQAQAHCMTEPHVATAYMDHHERLNIITSTQTPFHVRRILGKTLDLPLSKIRVYKPRVGGGYGGKQAIHGEFFVALVTFRTGKASRLIYTRKEVFESTYTRHPMRIDITVGGNKDGYIRAINMKILSNTGAFGEHALTVLMVAGAKTLPLYNRVEAVGFSGDVAYTNITPAGAYRGYGAIQGNFALESAMDELAEMLEIDPIELRRKNMILEGETSPIFKIMGEGGEGVAMSVDSCKLSQCLETTLDKIGWKEKYPSYKIDENRVGAVGLALAMQGSGIPYIDMAAAILKLNDDGFFNLMIGATDIGTGSDTILAQMAAETLEVAIDKIIVYSSDTDLTPFDTGAYASSTTYVSGHSVRIAAENMKKKIIDVAKKYFESEDVEYHDAKLISGDKEITLAELSTKLYYHFDQEQLVASGSYVGKKSPPPYMVGAVDIEIDKRTGQIKVKDYVASVDCGVPINPNLCKIQVEGAILQGLGMALFEDAKRNEKGALYNNTFMSYRVPTRLEVGSMHVSFEDSYEPSGPYGAKSVGEIGIDTPPAAIGNAVKNAIGKRIMSLPITPEKVWKAIHEGED